jgi:hypothetical protein
MQGKSRQDILLPGSTKTIERVMTDYNFELYYGVVPSIFVSQAKRRANMAAWERILHIQLDHLDLLRDPFSERKRENGKGQKKEKEIKLS